MNKKALIKIAGESIATNTLRACLTVGSIALGIGAVMVMVAIGRGAQDQIEARIQGLGTNMLVITAGAVRGGASGGAGSFNRLTVADVTALQREATTLSAVSPVIVTHSQVLGNGTNWRTEVDGVSPDYFTIRDWQLSTGAPFDDSDVQSNRSVAMLGATVVQNLFGNTDPTGKTIQISNAIFTVGGVLAKKGQGATGADQDDVILVPYTTAQSRLSGFTYLGQILASTSTTDAIPAAEDEIRGVMRESHRLADNAPDDFTVRDQTQIAATAASTTAVMTSLLAAVASVSLVVGGIGIMNIMLVSVTERTREIGIRRAIGARRTEVLAQFLTESVLMSLVGGILGLAAGFGGARLVERLTGWPVVTPLSAALLAVGFSAAIGMFFGYYPARKAARLDPIQALRYE